MGKRRRSKSFHRTNYARRTTGEKEKSIRKRTLIVAEGKSEVSYFNAIKRSKNFSNLTVLRSSGSAPKNVILYAEKICSKSIGNDYDQVFCVFDRDTDPNYAEAIESLGSLNGKRKYGGTEFIAVPSIPCFEYWYLLHMKDTTRSFGDRSSPCNEVVSELREFSEFKNYTKPNCEGFFETLEQNQQLAVSRAEKALRAAQKTGDSKYHENPSTRVHIVIKTLFEHLDQ